MKAFDKREIETGADTEKTEPQQSRSYRTEPAYDRRLNARLRRVAVWRSRGCGNRRRSIRRNGRRSTSLAGDRCQAVLAVQQAPHGPRARRAHRLAAVTAVTGCVHIGMDSTLHRYFPSSN